MFQFNIILNNAYYIRYSFWIQNVTVLILVCSTREILDRDIVYDPVLEIRSISREDEDIPTAAASISHQDSFVRDPSRLSITGLDENGPETSFSSQEANYDSRYIHG